MALRAAGEPAGSVHRSGGRTATAYLASAPASWGNAYELERGILAVVAIRRNPASFGGRNLVAALRAHIGARRRDRLGGELDLLGRAGAARRGLVGSGLDARLHPRPAAPNGGYAWSKSAAPDSNDTAAAVLALHAAGWAAEPVDRARLRVPRHRPDVVARLRASCPGAPRTASRRRGRSRPATRAACETGARGRGCWPASCPSGAFNYQPGTTITPAFVTAQVLPAIHGSWYPIR